MRSALIFALLVAACSAQRWNAESFRGPQSQGYQYQYNYSQCYGLARKSRQVRVDMPSLYNTKTGVSAPVPPALYNADQSVISKLESEGWVVRTQKSLVPQVVYERVPVCCPWEQSCDQRQPNQVSQDSNAPCTNGGQLIYKDGQQVCQCPDGFRGLWCQTPEIASKPEPNQNFPTGPVIRLASTSEPLINQAINGAELLRRQQQPMNQVINSPAAAPREMVPMMPYDQQAALWHQQALRARLAQIEDLYARTGGVPFRKRICANCPKPLLIRRPLTGPLRVPRPYFRPRANPAYVVSRASRPFPGPRIDNKPFTRVFNPYTSARPWLMMRNPYNTLTTSGQLPPKMIEGAQAIQMELQQRNANPYSVPNDPRYNNVYNNLTPQGGMYLPPQAARMPEARTPWDLDPFNQQQNPGFMKDPRAASKERQLLALAVFKQMMNQQRARMAAATPVLRNNQPNQPLPPMEVTKTTTPEAETKTMPAPLGANQQVALGANQQVPLGANQPVPNEYPQIPTPEEMTQMQQCQPVLEPQIKACFSSQGMTMEQFMNPEFMEKSSKVCQNSAQMVECIQKLEPVCGEAAVQSTKKITGSVLRMLGMVCQQIASRVPQQAVPLQQSQQQPLNEPEKTSGGTEPQIPTQSPNEVPDDQSMPTIEEQQQMRQCQGVLEPMLNECMRSYDVTIEQFMKPEFMAKARGVCQDSTNVAGCVNKLDSACGAPNVRTTKKMLNSILGMMGMVCHQIGGGQLKKDVAELVPEPPIAQTVQQKPEMAAPPQQRTLDPTDEQQEMPTPDEIRIVQECQPVLEPGLNECLKSYDLNLQQFASPQYMEKARIVCQNSNAVGECVRKLENSCGSPAVIRKMLMSMMRMMNMVCQQIQNRGAGDNSQPSATPNQTPTSETNAQAPSTGDAHQPGSNPPGMPTQEEINQIQQCQSQLEPKINECLKTYDVTIQQFHAPQFIEKSRKVCQDGQSVGPCVQRLDRECGEDSLLSTRRILKSVLGMMGMVCQQIQGKGPENIPRAHHGPLLRSGHMPHLKENPANENKQPDMVSGEANAVMDKQPTGETPSQGVSAKQAGGTGEEAIAKYLSRDLELFGYPLWLIITLILILAVLLLLFVMVACLCLRRKRKQRKVVITKDACEKPPLPEDDKLCTIGVPPPSYTTTAVQQNEDGLALPPIDIGEDSVSVSMDDSVNEKPPLDDNDSKTGKY